MWCLYELDSVYCSVLKPLLKGELQQKFLSHHKNDIFISKSDTRLKMYAVDSMYQEDIIQTIIKPKQKAFKFILGLFFPSNTSVVHPIPHLKYVPYIPGVIGIFPSLPSLKSCTVLYGRHK